MSERSVEHATFVVERSYDAAPHRVFAAWSDPEAKTRWFGSSDDRFELEFRVMQDAEDLVQETLFASWRSLEAFEGRSSLRSWLYRIATNRCLNALARNSRAGGRARSASRAVGRVERWRAS
jgi:DNA-directed RNA polymerase specialized sigma24 family protein